MLVEKTTTRGMKSINAREVVMGKVRGHHQEKMRTPKLKPTGVLPSLFYTTVDLERNKFGHEGGKERIGGGRSVEGELNRYRRN